jgi:hypothetical protein
MEEVQALEMVFAQVEDPRIERTKRKVYLCGEISWSTAASIASNILMSVFCCHSSSSRRGDPSAFR